MDNFQIEDIADKTRGHIVDSIFFGDGFGTEEARKIFCDLARLQRWLDVEVALAESLAEVGLIPKKAAQELRKTGKLELFDLKKIQKDIVATTHCLMPLLQAWQKLVTKETGQYIHYGATSQDIHDTAQILEIRDVIKIVERDLKEIIKTLTFMTKKYRDLVMVGRTHGQNALPTTFGLKVAIWLDESIRNYDRLITCKKEVLVSQLFGGVGTMAAFSNQGINLLQIFSKKLNLVSPLVSWHNSRDRIVALLSSFALIAGTFGKIANEIIQLNKNGIDELAEPFKIGHLGSSTMPHKRNPEICERIVLLSKFIKSNASLSFESLGSEHERDFRCVRLEWVTVTDISLYLCCTLNLAKSILHGLVVNRNKINDNVQSSKEFISSEALMFSLAEKMGKQNAYQVVYDASMQAIDKNTSVLEELLKFPEINAHFDKNYLEKIIDPANYTGLSAQLIDNVIAHSINKFNFNEEMLYENK